MTGLEGSLFDLESCMLRAGDVGAEMGRFEGGKVRRAGLCWGVAGGEFRGGHAPRSLNGHSGVGDRPGKRVWEVRATAQTFKSF